MKKIIVVCIIDEERINEDVGNKIFEKDLKYRPFSSGEVTEQSESKERSSGG